jgi:hypothetical protein
LEKLAEAGFGKEELNTLQLTIDAEKSDLFDVLEYVFNSDNTTNDKRSNELLQHKQPFSPYSTINKRIYRIRIEQIH